MKKIVFIFLLLSSFQFIINIKADEVSDLSVELIDGASIRTLTPVGLRFKATVSGDNTDAIAYGMVFANGEIINPDSLYVNAPGCINAEVTELTSTNEYSVSLINYPEYAYTDDVTARAYIVLSDNTYVYSNNMVTRNIKEVADVAYASGDTDAYIKELASWNKTVLVDYKQETTTVAIDTPASELNLPSMVTLYDKNNKESILDVVWDLSTYNSTQIGTQEISGTVKLETEYVLKKISIKHKIIVGNMITPTPTNLEISENRLIWDEVDGVTDYQVNINYNGDVAVYYTITNQFDLSNYLTNSGVYTFTVIALKGNEYSADSLESKPVVCKFDLGQTSQELFNYNFIDLVTLGSDWIDDSSGRYADDSIALKATSKAITTPSFTAKGTFTVTATIKGQPSSGTSAIGTITIYGLDGSGNVVESKVCTDDIANKQHEISVAFTNTSIKKIKFEYTSKTSGNVALYSLVANYTESASSIDVLTSISLVNYTTDYNVNDTFDYAGKLIKIYKSGDTEEVDLNSIINDISLDFDTTTPGDYQGTITYLGLSTTFNYIVNDFEQPTIGEEVFNYDFITLTTLDSSWVDDSSGRYADNSIAFKSGGKAITTPAFQTKGLFTVTASIKGNGASGDAVITLYGLASDGSILEEYSFVGAIQNSAYEIKATFTNTNITKIKFEYTTKVTGNVGLYSLVATYTDDVVATDEIISISLKNYTTSYILNANFDYVGTIVKTYESGKTQEVILTSIKDSVEISFNTTTLGEHQGTITYLGLEAVFSYIVTEASSGGSGVVEDVFTTTIDNVTVYSLDLSDNLKDTISLISVIKGTSQINILIDTSFNLTTENKAQLNLELSSLVNNNIRYYYSTNNNSYFSSLGATALVTNQEYKFAPDVYLTIANNGFVLDILGFIYYNIQDMTNENISLNQKVDVLWSNHTMTTEILKALDPETVILPEGSLTNNLELAKSIYTLDNEIYIYSTTLNKTIWHTFTTSQFILDGESDKELSSYSEWSNSETDGLHHASIENYLYRSAYYGDISNLSGTSLRNALREVISKSHTTMVSYGENREYLALTDADSQIDGNMILMYSGDSISGEWDQGKTWNREHVWPQSLSGGLYDDIDNNDRNAGSDLHHIKPVYQSINSSRGNKPYGSSTTTQYYCPREEVQGDIARILFYLSVRYDMEIMGSGTTVAESIELLLKWNENDQIDAFERIRNQTVQKIQGNFNPFIDNPWLADLIW